MPLPLHASRPATLPAKSSGALIGMVLLLLGLFYAFFFQRYRAYEIDNPWYLSFSRSFWVDHYRKDFFLAGTFPDGMGGTVVFGAIPALIQGMLLNSFDWLPVPAMLLSTLLVLLGLRCWFAFLRSSGFSSYQSTACILALGLSEPFVGMADRFRFEPFSFLLFAVAFWCAGKQYTVASSVIGLLALEIEPAAALVSAVVFWYLLRSGAKPKALLTGSVIALSVFAGVYLLLHPDILHTLQATNWHRGAAQKDEGGFLRAYFIARRRHLPELALFAACFALLLKRFKDADPFVKLAGELCLLSSLFAFAMRWPTPAYMVFWFPFAIVIASWCLQSMRMSPWLLPGTMAIIMVPQYVGLAWINRHDGFTTSDFQAVRAAVESSERQIGLDPEKAQIMGDYSLWFAHPERYRALARTNLPFIAQEDLFLCFDSPLRPPAMVDALVRYCSDVQERLAVQEVRHLDVRGHRLYVYSPLRDERSASH